MQASVRDLESSTFVIGAPRAARVECGVIHAMASALTLAVVLVLSRRAPEIGVAAAVPGLAMVGLLVFTLLRSCHDFTPALHG